MCLLAIVGYYKDRASQKSRSCRGRASARFSFAVSGHFAFPAGRQNAQELQKIFPVAAGDHAQGQHARLKATFEKPCKAPGRPSSSTGKSAIIEGEGWQGERSSLVV